MLGKLARGTYVVVLSAMVVAWVVSLNKEAPAQQPQPDQQVWDIYA